MDNIIELKDVCYKYPNSTENILNNINLEIEKNKFTVIMGCTGAGKTTLLMSLNGLIPQLLEGELSGSIYACGKDVRKYRVQTMTEHIGLVLQDTETQIFGRTVEEDTSFGPRNFCIPKDEIARRVNDALVRVRLTGYNNRNTDELSGGEKQRLAIAGVLAMKPEILILDEPTSELDPLGRNEIYTTINDLRNEKGLTIIGVEHSSQEIVNKADEIVVIDNGKIVWKGKPGDLFRNIDLLDTYGIKPIPVSKIGWNLYKKGIIKQDEIPLSVDEAENLISKLLKNKKINTTNIEIGIQTTSEVKQQVNSKPLISIKNLSYTYESQKLALKNINVDIYQGEFIALIGQNGAGKTTLAKFLNGLLKNETEDITVCGLNVKDYETYDLAKYVGYVFQNPDQQIFSTTVYKELEFGLKNAGISEEEIDKRINKVLDFTGLTKYKDDHPFSLGKGERQMIAVASILAIEPQIIVVDEPTTGQDWRGINRIMELIKKLHQSGTTIIMITHDMDIVSQYAKRTIVMRKGCIILDGETDEVFSNVEYLKRAYVTSPQISLLSKRLENKCPGMAIKDEKQITQIILDSLEG